MKTFLKIILLFLPLCVFAQKDVNYDETKVPVYTLPDVLTCNNGEKVTTVEQWEAIRRPEILNMFSTEMYGKTPQEKIKVEYETLSENSNDLGGLATSKQVRFVFSNGKKRIEAILLMYVPNESKGKVPVFVGYNFKGNHSTSLDTTVYYPPLFHLIKTPDHPDWVRGVQKSRWCYEKIIKRGYAVATMCYHDIFPDVKGMKEQSIAALFTDYDLDMQKEDEWQAIGAWAWGSSRIVDFLETQEKIDVDKIIIMGHSRQGKAALWAGAQDERFSIVISNDSGSGGAALSKREFGETIAIVSSIQPPWFCPAFNKYRNNESHLPFDQHELIALIAPRNVYVSSAEEDLWADPKGEFLSAYHAGEVYKLYGLSPIEFDKMPKLHEPIKNDVGYHIRAGKHDVIDYDWESFMDFADKHFNKNKMN